MCIWHLTLNCQSLMRLHVPPHARATWALRIIVGCHSLPLEIIEKHTEDANLPDPALMWWKCARKWPTMLTSHNRRPPHLIRFLQLDPVKSGIVPLTELVTLIGSFSLDNDLLFFTGYLSHVEPKTIHLLHFRPCHSYSRRCQSQLGLLPIAQPSGTMVGCGSGYVFQTAH